MVKKSTGVIYTKGDVFRESEVPRANADYTGLKYGMAKEKTFMEKVGEGLGKAIGVKPPKKRHGAVPSISVQKPPPSMSKGKSIEGRVVRNR